jgi:hypothetical protein
MSWRVRFDVVGPNGLIKKDETFGTISYGETNRKVFLEYFKECFSPEYASYWKCERYSWVEYFTQIYLTFNNSIYIFERSELINK